MSEEDIDFLMSIQGLEQSEFDKAYLERENKKLEKEIERLHSIIKEVRELLSKYNDKESNYYVPVDIALKLLDKEK